MTHFEKYLHLYAAWFAGAGFSALGYNFMTWQFWAFCAPICVALGFIGKRKA